MWVPRLEITKKGDWVDLYVANQVKYPKVTRTTPVKEVFLDLGIEMELPEGYEVIIAPRSSTFRNWGLILTNSIGVIDNTYSGPDDTWKAHVAVISRRDEIKEIPINTRLFHFRIQLSQKATFWQKVKWLFTSKIEFVEVDELPPKPNRGGYGTSGF